jgi:hypothetical protein
MISYAFFADFKGGPTLLLWGDNADMPKLSEFLRRHARAPRQINFDELDFCSAAGQTVVVAPKEGSSGGVRRVVGDESAFEWELSASEARKFADMVDVLATPSRRGHQYLDYPNSPQGITVMVSCGEYPADLISRDT